MRELKKYCKRGHERTPENLTTSGMCRTCNQDCQRRCYKDGPSFHFVLIPKGSVFGKWVVKEYLGNGRYRCQCECGCIRKIPGQALRVGKRTACRRCSLGLTQEESLFNRLLSNYRGGAKTRGLEFKLTKGQALDLFKSNCSYCGKPPSAKLKFKNQQTWESPVSYNGIDRVVNSIGYLLGNCVSCCKICNHMKYILTEEEFLSHIKSICEHRRLT
jgi:hypothetical protein